MALARWFGLQLQQALQSQCFRATGTHYPPGDALQPLYAPGEDVYYLSLSFRGQWMQGRVLQMLPGGHAYNLSCKPAAPVECLCPVESARRQPARVCATEMPARIFTLQAAHAEIGASAVQPLGHRVQRIKSMPPLDGLAGPCAAQSWAPPILTARPAPGAQPLAAWGGEPLWNGNISLAPTVDTVSSAAPTDKTVQAMDVLPAIARRSDSQSTSPPRRRCAGGRSRSGSPSKRRLRPTTPSVSPDKARREAATRLTLPSQSQSPEKRQIIQSPALVKRRCSNSCTPLSAEARQRLHREILAEFDDALEKIRCNRQRPANLRRPSSSRGSTPRCGGPRRSASPFSTPGTPPGSARIAESRRRSLRQAAAATPGGRRGSTSGPESAGQWLENPGAWYCF